MATIATIPGADGRSMTGQIVPKSASPSTERTPASPTAPEAPQPAPAAPDTASLPGPADMEQLMSDLREALAQVRPEPFRVGFRQEEGLETFVVEIRDVAGDLIKQFPPEKIINLRQKLDDLVGMVVDETT